MSQEIASLFAKVGAETSAYERSMRGVRSDLEQTQGAMSKFSDFGVAAFKAVAVAAVAIGAGIVAGVGAAIKGAADMEQGVANIGAAMQLAAEDTAKLQDYILELGLDPTLVVNATQASEAIATLGTAGLTLQQIMGGAAESTILLSNATGGSFAGSAALMTDLMSQFNITAEDTGRILNQVTGLTVATKFGFEDVAGAFAQVGGVAGALGLSLEDTASILAVTSSSFASGSDAATSMKTFLQRLVPTTKEASKAMAALNLLNEDGTSKFFDASGAMKDSAEIAALLQGALGGLSAAQRIEAASTIFGTDAMRTAFGLMEGGAAAINDAKKLIGDTNAQEMAAKRMDTLSGAWQIFRGVIDTVSLGIGEKFIPVVRKAVEWLTDLAQKWGPRVIDFFGTLADRMTSAFEGVGAAVATFRSFFSLQLATITSDNASWGERMEAIWHIVATSARTLWQTLIDNLLKLIPDWLTALGEWAVAAWQWIVDSAPTALQKLGAWALALWQWLTTNLPTWISNLATWATALWQWIVDVTPVVLTKLGEWGSALYGWLSTNLPAWGKKLGEWGKATWDWIVIATPIAVSKLSEWASALWQWLTTNAPNWAQKLGEWGRAAWQWIVDAIPVLVQKLGEWGRAIWQWLVANGPSWLGPLAKWTVAAWQWVVDATEPLRAALAELWKPIEWFIGMFRLHWTLMDITNATVGDRLMAVWYLLRNVAGVVFAAIDEWLLSISGGFLKWSDIAIGSILALTIMFWPAIAGAFAAVMGAIGAFVAAWAPILALFAAAIIAVALVRNAWERDWGGIRTFTTDALKVMGDAFAPLLDTIKEFGGQALAEIVAWATGNETNFEAVGKIWDAAKKAFGAVFDAIVAKLVEWGKAARDWFEKHFPDASKKLMEAVDKIKANFKELWDVLQPLIQKMKDEFDRYRENWENNSGKVGDAMQKLQKFLDGIFTIMATAIGLFVSNAINILTLIIQFINGDWAGAWQTLQQIGQDTWDAMITIVGTAIDVLLGLFGTSIADIQDWLGRTAAILGEWAGNFTAWVTGLRDVAKTKMEELRESVVGAVSAFVDATKLKVGEWKDWIIQKYVEIRDSIKEKMEAFRDNVVNPVKQFVDDTKTKIEEWKTAIVAKYEEFRNAVTTKMEAIKTSVIEPIKQFIEDTKTRIEGWKTTFVAVYEAIRAAIVTKMDAVKAAVIDPIKAFIEDTKDRIDTWRGQINAIYDMLRTNVQAYMMSLKTYVIDPVKQFIQDTKDRIDEWRIFLLAKWAAIKDKVKEHMDLVKGYVIDPIVSFVSTTKTKIGEWKEWLVEKFEQVRDSVKNVLDPAKWLQWGKDLVQGLWNGLKEKWDSLVNWFSGVWSNLVDKFDKFFEFGSPSKLMHQRGEWLMQGLQGGINSASQLPISAMESLANNVGGKVDGMLNAVRNSATQIGNVINSIPPMPTVPFVNPPLVNPPTVTPPTPPGGNTGPIQSAGVEFGLKNLGNGLNMIASFVDISDTIADIQSFAGKAQAFLTAPGQPQLQGSSAAYMAMQNLQGGGLDSTSVNSLLSQVQTLIRLLAERGFGTQFNIQQAPDATLQQQTELEALVAYLNALYG